MTNGVEQCTNIGVIIPFSDISYRLLLSTMIKEFVKSLHEDGNERLRVRLTIKKGELVDILFQYESFIKR